MREFKTKEDNLDKDIKSVIPGWKRLPQPDFVQLYLKDVGRLWGVSTPAQQLFGEFMKLIEYSPKTTMHNLVELNKRKRKDIMKNLGIEDHVNPYVYLNRATKELITSGLIITVKDDISGEAIPDMYIVDPAICSKANWGHTELLQSIKLEITYSASQRTLITFIETMDEEDLKEKINENKKNLLK